MLFFKSLFDVPWAKAKAEADNKRRTEKVSVGGLDSDTTAALVVLTDQVTAVTARPRGSWPSCASSATTRYST